MSRKDSQFPIWRNTQSSEVSIIFSPCFHSVTTIVSLPLHSMMLKCMNVMISWVGVNDHSVPLRPICGDLPSFVDLSILKIAFSCGKHIDLIHFEQMILSWTKFLLHFQFKFQFKFRFQISIQIFISISISISICDCDCDCDCDCNLNSNLILT